MNGAEATGRPPADLRDEALGTIVRARRVGLGLTLVYVGAAIGVSNQQLHQYEVGRYRIPFARLAALAKALDIPLRGLVWVFDADEHELALFMRLKDSAIDELLAVYEALDLPGRSALRTLLE